VAASRRGSTGLGATPSGTSTSHTVGGPVGIRRGRHIGDGKVGSRPTSTPLSLSSSSSGAGGSQILALWATFKEVDVHPEPHPEPGCELACGVRAPVGGVISTSWKTPPRGSETTTNAGELLRDPVAQLGRQLCQVNVPLPSPVPLPQVDHVTADMDMSPAQPMSMVFGRT
jgi:hypothetical protein